VLLPRLCWINKLKLPQLTKSQRILLYVDGRGCCIADAHSHQSLYPYHLSLTSPHPVVICWINICSCFYLLNFLVWNKLTITRAVPFYVQNIFYLWFVWNPLFLIVFVCAMFLFCLVTFFLLVFEWYQTIIVLVHASKISTMSYQAYAVTE